MRSGSLSPALKPLSYSLADRLSARVSPLEHAVVIGNRANVGGGEGNNHRTGTAVEGHGRSGNRGMPSGSDSIAGGATSFRKWQNWALPGALSRARTASRASAAVVEVGEEAANGRSDPFRVPVASGSLAGRTTASREAQRGGAAWIHSTHLFTIDRAGDAGRHTTSARRHGCVVREECTFLAQSHKRGEFDVAWSGSHRARLAHNKYHTRTARSQIVSKASAVVFPREHGSLLRG